MIQVVFLWQPISNRHWRFPRGEEENTTFSIVIVGTGLLYLTSSLSELPFALSLSKHQALRQAQGERDNSDYGEARYMS